MRERVITAVVLAPVVLAVLFLSNPWPITGLGFVVSLFCAAEARTLLPLAWRIRALAYLGFPIGIGLVCAHPSSIGSAVAVSTCTGLGVLASFLVASDKFKNPATVELSALWFAAPLVACVVLHGQRSSDRMWAFDCPLLMAMLPVWAGDIAGIFAGKAFGKHLLLPSISPKKTVEGAIANLLAATVVGAIFGNLIGLSMLPSLTCGFVAGFVGQLGDLFESYVKRRANVKDSGTLLPGHGGILDRIDSLLFTAPAIALVLALFR